MKNTASNALNTRDTTPPQNRVLEGNKATPLTITTKILNPLVLAAFGKKHPLSLIFHDIGASTNFL